MKMLYRNHYPNVFHPFGCFKKLRNILILHCQRELTNSGIHDLYILMRKAPVSRALARRNVMVKARDVL